MSPCTRSIERSTLTRAGNHSCVVRLLFRPYWRSSARLPFFCSCSSRAMMVLNTSFSYQGSSSLVNANNHHYWPRITSLRVFRPPVLSCLSECFALFVSARDLRRFFWGRTDRIRS